MKVYAGLYAIIWLILLEILLQTKAITFDYVAEVHIGLGALVLGLAFLNYNNVIRTAAPDRIKRILKAALTFAAIQPILGFIIYLNVNTKLVISEFEICQMGFAPLIHLVIAIAIITQCASAATSYDMWEEKEFLTPAKDDKQPQPAQMGESGKS